MKQNNKSKFGHIMKKILCGLLATISAFVLIPNVQEPITADAAIFEEVVATATSSTSVQLSVNKPYYSKNHKFCLICQSDGNMVVYRFDAGLWERGPAVWNSKTAGYSGNKFYLQKDGNLVIYNNKMQPLWNSGSYGHESGTKRLYLSDKGELYIRQNLKKIWTAGVPSAPTDQVLLAGKYTKKSGGQTPNDAFMMIHFPDSKGVMKVEFYHIYAGLGTRTGVGYVSAFKEYGASSADIFTYRWKLVSTKKIAENDPVSQAFLDEYGWGSVEISFEFFCNSDGTQIMTSQQKLQKYEW